MAFGAFAPLPLRLGDDGGITADQFLRLSADVAEAGQSLPFAWGHLRCDYSQGYLYESGFPRWLIVDWRSRDPSAQPSVFSPTSGAPPTLTFPSSWTDDAGVTRPMPAITSARATIFAGPGSPLIGIGADSDGHLITSSVTVSELTVTVKSSGNDLTSAQPVWDLFVVVWAAPETGALGAYGATADKTDVPRSERVSPAWQWWRTLKTLRGKGAYTEAVTSVVGLADLSVARHLGYLSRLAQKLTWNRLPETAGERLGYWAKVLGIDSRRDPDWRVRELASARYEARAGALRDVVDGVCAKVLGSDFVRTWRTRSTAISAEPVPTYWLGGVVPPLPSAWTLDPSYGAPWLSARSRLDVEVSRPASTTDADWDRKTGDLIEQLDRILPAWVVFDWATELTGGGLILDATPLDEGGLG